MKEHIASYFDIIRSLSRVIDLTHPYLTNHHERTAYISGRMAKLAGYSIDHQHLVMIAAALHDIGVLFENEFYELHQFPEHQETIHRHSVAGAQLLSVFNKFWSISSIIKYHHVNWDYGRGSSFMGEGVPESAHIIHLADRVDALIDRSENIFESKERIVKIVQQSSGSIFNPEHVEIFTELAKHDYFWFDIISINRYDVFDVNFSQNPVVLSTADFLELAKLISHLIDFRCKFTATHSASAASVSSFLSKKAGMSENECMYMEFAGYMHDVGKLAVPMNIINKTSSLTESEYMTTRNHVYHTYKIFSSLESFSMSRDWAGLHHERLDGSGYPFGLHAEDIPLGSRILAVADIFSALCENRPYRKMLDKDTALNELNIMAKEGRIDASICNLLSENYFEVDDARRRGIEETVKKFNKFAEVVEKAHNCTF